MVKVERWGSSKSPRAARKTFTVQLHPSTEQSDYSSQTNQNIQSNVTACLVCHFQKVQVRFYFFLLTADTVKQQWIVFILQLCTVKTRKYVTYSIESDIDSVLSDHRLKWTFSDWGMLRWRVRSLVFRFVLSRSVWRCREISVKYMRFCPHSLWFCGTVTQ